MDKIVIITGNDGKLCEFERLLGVDLDKCKIDLPEIQSTDIAEVAKIKAEFAFSQLGRPCFVDDTGLTINEWGNLPGALIKWFIDNVGNDGILKMLLNYNSRGAFVATAIGYCDERGSRVFTGEVTGSIAKIVRGENGFGYDTIFIPDGSDKTFAEMTDNEKDSFSMRSLAAEKFSNFLLNK